MFNADCKSRKAVTLNRQGYRLHKRKLPRRTFDCDLPNGSRAHKYLVRGAGHCSPHRNRKPRVGPVPPQKYVRIQQKAHWLEPEIAQDFLGQRRIKIVS